MARKLIFASTLLFAPLQADITAVPQEIPYTITSETITYPTEYLSIEDIPPVVEAPLANAPKPPSILSVTKVNPNVREVSILSDVATAYNNNPAQKLANMSLKDVRLAVDADNITLQNVLHNIIDQAEPYTGPWEVKWRMKPENQSILNQRVNLIAEGSFNDFVFHLTDRIRNMTGTQLFVSHFDAARVIIISDTYY